MASRKNFVRWARETSGGEELLDNIDLSDYATRDYVDNAVAPLLLGVASANSASDGQALGSGGTTSSSLVDLDATNLSVTFTVPESGNVLVVLNGVLQKVTSGLTRWGVREGSSFVAQGLVSSGTLSDIRCTLSLYITGLVAGSQHTYKWGFATSAGTTYVVGGTGHGPAVMQIWSA